MPEKWSFDKDCEGQRVKSYRVRHSQGWPNDAFALEG